MKKAEVAMDSLDDAIKRLVKQAVKEAVAEAIREAIRDFQFPAPAEVEKLPAPKKRKIKKARR